MDIPAFKSEKQKAEVPFNRCKMASVCYSSLTNFYNLWNVLLVRPTMKCLRRKTRVKGFVLIFSPRLGLKWFQLGPSITDVIITSIYIFRLCTKKCNNGQRNVFHCLLRTKRFWWNLCRTKDRHSNLSVTELSLDGWWWERRASCQPFTQRNQTKMTLRLLFPSTILKRLQVKISNQSLQRKSHITH